MSHSQITETDAVVLTLSVLGYGNDHWVLWANDNMIFNLINKCAEDFVSYR